MSLFPKCTFEVAVPRGVLTAGERLEGTVIVDVPSPIERAKALLLTFSSITHAGYGSGNGRTTFEEPFFAKEWRVGLPPGKVLEAKVHRFPFTFDVPYDLPPACRGPDCHIEHSLEARLDVDWAVDPTVIFKPEVEMPAVGCRRTPKTVRSPDGFDDRIVIELTLESTTVATDESLLGEIAVRGGQAGSFPTLLVELKEVFALSLGPGDVRYKLHAQLRLKPEELSSGEPLKFSVPMSGLTPAFRARHLGHRFILAIRTTALLGRGKEFHVDVDVVPPGSSFTNVSGRPAAVGSEWLRQLGERLERETGLVRVPPPHIVRGAVGAVEIAVDDAPSAGMLGIDVHYTLPNLGLGIAWTERGLRTAFRDGVALPEELAETYFLKLAPRSPVVGEHDPSLQAFIATILTGLGAARDLRLSDDRLSVHYAFQEERENEITRLVIAAQERAQRITRSLTSLPFGADAASRAGWEALAAAQHATLVPTVPAIEGLSFSVRTSGGLSREIRGSIRVDFTSKAPVTEVHLQFDEWPIRQPLAGGAESGASAELRAQCNFSRLEADGRRAVLTRDGFVADPSELLPLIEAFIDWLVEAWGERRADRPYR